MPIITLDKPSYDLDTLSDEARAQLPSLQFVDAELQRLNAQTAVMQAYQSVQTSSLVALKSDIAKGMADVQAGRVSGMNMASIKDKGRAMLKAKPVN